MDLPLRGLMCIPPVDEEPACISRLLAKMAARNGLDGLSMGMSADFETAIAFRRDPCPGRLGDLRRTEPTGLRHDQTRP
jgi:hypothetical protein